MNAMRLCSVPRGLVLSFVCGLLWCLTGLALASASAPQAVVLFEIGADGVRKPVVQAQVWLGARMAGSDASGTAVFHGVPAGQHPLRVAEADFEQVARPVTLAPGLRQPVEVELTRVEPVNWSGRVLLDGSGQPLAGARVMLEPLQVAAIHGPARAVTDREGQFRFLALSPGKYRAQFSAPGTRTLSREVSVSAGPLADVRLVAEPGGPLLGTPPRPPAAAAEGAPPFDANEPNQDIPQAKPLAPYEEAVGVIWPVGDRDVFRIELPRPGRLIVEEPGQSYERVLRLRDAEGRVIAERGVGRDQPLLLTTEVAAGVHFLDFGEWGDNAASDIPYRLSYMLLPDDDLGEADAPLAQTRRVLPIGSSVGATLMPSGDRDVYVVEVPSAGRLQLSGVAATEMAVRVHDAAGRVLAEQGRGQEKWVNLPVFFNTPQRVYVTVEEWGRNNASTVAYALRATFEHADDGDRPQRNDDFDHATPMVPGETFSGSYMPMGDRDFFVVNVDFPGYLQVEAVSAHETLLRLHGADRAVLAERGVGAGRTAMLRHPVGPGTYYIMVSEWGENVASVSPYTLNLKHEAAEPDSAWPLQSGALRTLRAGEAQAFAIDHVGDAARFGFEASRPGTLHIGLAGPLEKLVRVFDAASDKLLLERGFGANAPARLPLRLDAPAQLRVEVREWGDNAATLDPLFIMIDEGDRTLAAERVVWRPDPARPGQGWLQREAIEHAAELAQVQVDLNGDGRPDVQLTDREPVAVRLERAERFAVTAYGRAAGGLRSVQRLWADARGPQVREGLHLSLAGLLEGQVVSEPQRVSVLAASLNNVALARVEVRLNGELIEASSTPPFHPEINWAALGADESRLEVHARDVLGSEARLTRHFRLSEYFGLSPQDGATLAAEAPSVSWRAPSFGPSRVRYRPQGSGDDAWQEVEGQPGQLRRVSLPGLESGVRYEFQPLGGAEPGPLRTLTRVKGLAFGRSQYAANIQRDYDQRVGITVRNNGDEALQVRLESDPPADPLLLASFVGTGSEDKPFELAPGEARAFQFAVSAQNVDTATHRIPIRIVSDKGLSDESEIVLHVRLPHVELEWSDLGVAPNGTGRLLRLLNRGDAITDLSVEAAHAHAVVMSPTVRHGLLPRGGHLDFIVTPRFYKGFTGVSTRLLARGMDKVFEHAYEMKLAPGEAMHQVWLLPGVTAEAHDADTLRALEAGMAERLQRARAVNLATLDWGQAQKHVDSGGDTHAARWRLEAGDIAWLGSDGDGDGVVDHVVADVDRNGINEYAAVRVGQDWRETNLVEAWLEMSFALRGSRDSYKPHDVEVVLNGVTIGLLKDMLPEGNFGFRIPPGVLRFDDSGLPGDNRVGLRTTHLRGGHYAVNSDFRFKFRLTATPVWMVARSEAEARERALKTSGVSLGAPDFSLSAAALHIDGPAEPAAGDTMKLRFPVRNLGATAGRSVIVVLQRLLPDGTREEQARTLLPRVGLDGVTGGEIEWAIRGGLNRLALVADPEGTSGDPDPSNNEALFMLHASGDDTPPSLRVTGPADGAEVQQAVVTLAFEVNDDAGPVVPMLSIDGGLWHELPATQGRASVPLLLQPGAHRIELRVADAAGNEASVAHRLRVARPLPEARILAPADGATLSTPAVTVDIAVPSDVGLVAARSAGGPWHKASLLGDRAQVELPLRAGEQLLEVMVSDRHGVLRMLETRVRRDSQPSATERLSGAAASDQGLLWPAGHANLEIDLFRASSGVLRKLDLEPGQEAVRLWEEARRRQAQGDYAGALTLYRDSLMLKPDSQTDERVRKLEAYLGIRRIGSSDRGRQ